MNRAGPALHSLPPRTYAELIRRLPIRPIRDEVDYENAMEMANRLAGLLNMTEDQADYLEVLSDELEKYERVRDAIDTTDLKPLDLLRSLLADNGMNASDLGRLLGNRQLGAAILRGERQLSKNHIRALSERFKVNPSLFL